VQSVLSRVTSADLVLEPFPHVVVQDALDPALCERLVAEFPPLRVLTGSERSPSNRRFSYPARRALSNPEIPEPWRELVRVHTGQAFLEELVALFAPAIRAEYPALERRLGPLSALRAGVREVDDYEWADVLLDAQICVNTPVRGRPSSVRRGHVDRFDKLFAGLFYLRDPDDASRGGDLEILRFRGDETGFHGKYIDDRYLEVARVVPYRSNVLVLFLNGPRALHAVTERTPTPAPRRFLNLVGEVREPLFDLRDRQMRWSGARRVLRGAGKVRRAVEGLLARG